MKKTLLAFLLILSLCIPCFVGCDISEAVKDPTEQSTNKPTEAPSSAPTAEPSEIPSSAPTGMPTENPTSAPTAEPTEEPNEEPTVEPTEEPTEEPKETEQSVHVHTFGELEDFGNNEGLPCEKRTYRRVCSECYVVEFVSGKPDDHTYPDGFEYDKENHWKTCSRCGMKNYTESHFLNEDGDCTICEFEGNLAYKPSSDATYNGEEIEITFYHTMGATLGAVLDKYVAEFNKLYPNIKVVHSQEGGYDDVRDKISKELTVGNQPNIAYCYPDHVALYNLTGAVVTLDNLIASTNEVKHADGTTEILGLTEAQINDFIDAYYNEGKQFGDGLMYTLPLSKSTEVLYYNKTFFDANGLKVPTTWDEMEQVCKKILEIDPNCIPLGYDSEANWFITMCAQSNSPYTSATGEHFLFDDYINRSFVKRFSEWHQKGYVTTQEIYGAYTSGLFVAQTGTKSYMSIGSSAGATHQRPAKGADGQYPFEVGIATIPQLDAANKKVISLGPSVCIFEASEQEVIASWLFVKFLTTKVEFQAEFGMASGYVPVLESVAQNPVYAAFIEAADGGNNIAALSAKVCLEQKDAYFTPAAFIGSSAARDQVGFLMRYCMIKYATAADKDAMIKKAFEDAVAECIYQYGTGEATGVNKAANYISKVYRDAEMKTTHNDYELLATVTVDDVVYTVTWTVNNENIKINKDEKSGFYVVDIPSNNVEECEYILIATITSPDGESATKSMGRVLPVISKVEGVETDLQAETAYKLFFDHKGVGKVLFLTAETSGNYIKTVADPKVAADFFAEAADGGFKVYTLVNGAKSYIKASTVPKEDGKISKVIGFDAAGSVFKYNKEINAWYTTIDGVNYTIGTYGTYETVSISEDSYFTPENTGVSQFPVEFIEKAAGEAIAPSVGPADPTELTPIADAVAKGLAMAHNTFTVEKYLVKGTVVEVVNTIYGNLYIEDAEGNKIYVYGLYNEDGSVRFDALATQPKVGDVLTVMGVIGQYNDAAQIKNGWIKKLDAVVCEHTYSAVCDATCNKCGATRTAEAHVYDNACDADCNNCAEARDVEGHKYDNVCDADCNTCGTERDVEGHKYDNECDADCNTCGTAREVEGHKYDSACDADCNTCGTEREVGEHVYNNACDADCNVCGAEREVEAHVYDNDYDVDCNVCDAKRQ